VLMVMKVTVYTLPTYSCVDSGEVAGKV